MKKFVAYPIHKVIKGLIKNMPDLVAEAVQSRLQTAISEIQAKEGQLCSPHTESHTECQRCAPFNFYTIQ